MHRTTVMLPPELKAKAERYARRQGISLGELLRMSLARTLEAMLEDHPDTDPLFSDRAVYQGETPADLAGRHDEYLYSDDRES